VRAQIYHGRLDHERRLGIFMLCAWLGFDDPLGVRHAPCVLPLSF
jgi:hypothetical protein